MACSKHSEVVILHNVKQKMFSSVVTFHRVQKFGMGFFFLFLRGWGLIFGPGIFLSFDFCPIRSSPSLEIRSPPPRPPAPFVPTWGFYQPWIIQGCMRPLFFPVGGGEGGVGGAPSDILCTIHTHDCHVVIIVVVFWCLFFVCFFFSIFAVHISNVCGWPGCGPWWLRHGRRS